MQSSSNQITPEVNESTNDNEPYAKILEDKPAKNMPNPINSFLITIIVILIALSGFLGWQNYRLLTSEEPTPISTPTPKPSPSPSPSTSNEAANWNTYQIKSLDLTYKAPYELQVTLEEPDENTVTLYIQNSDTYYECKDETDCYYQLYLISQTDIEYAESDLESLKDNLIDKSIKDLNIAGHPALEGQIEGERNRLVTYIIKDNTLITVFTSDPTEQNKEITNKILETFTFDK